MIFKPNQASFWIAAASLCHVGVISLQAQTGSGSSGQMPRVVVPSSGQQVRPGQSAARILYPWKTYVTCTVFWVGEKASENNATPNHKSSWDQQWTSNYGGFDDPNPAKRIADHAAGDFRPKEFVPKLNPFYIALPYNDIATGGGYKAEASRVIPWFSRFQSFSGPTRSVCKGRWVQIFRGGKSCYAQWEDCGPWETDDWEFVFGDKAPKTTHNGSAGIDLSPSVRDYLMLASGDKVHWRFVEEAQVPFGPWKKYGKSEPLVANPPPPSPESESQQRYLEYLRKLREEQFLKKSYNR